MEPQQLNQQPSLSPKAPQQPAPQTSPTKHRTALILILWPAIALGVIFLLYALLNVLIPEQPPTGEQLFSSTSPAKAALNTIFYFLGGVTFIFGPISFIIGIVLLIKQRKGRNAQN